MAVGATRNECSGVSSFSDFTSALAVVSRFSSDFTCDWALRIAAADACCFFSFASVVLASDSEVVSFFTVACAFCSAVSGLVVVFGTLFVEGFESIAYFAVALAISWQLTLLAAAVVPALLFFSRILGKRIRKSAAGMLEKRENLVFLPGVSSKDHVTEVSGRGYGMIAVRKACEALGGKVEVHSEPGRGTHIRFAFPKGQAIYQGHAEVLRQARGHAA